VLNYKINLKNTVKPNQYEIDKKILIDPYPIHLFFIILDETHRINPEFNTLAREKIDSSEGFSFFLKHQRCTKKMRSQNSHSKQLNSID
jgi:hypothetical protein